MKKILSYLFIILIISCGMFNTVGQAEVNIDLNIEEQGSIVKIMDDIYIPNHQVINGDIVAIVGDIKVDGKVNGDIVTVVGDIEVNNSVEGDLVALLGEIIKNPEAKVKGGITEVNSLNINMLGDFKLPLMMSFFNWGFKLFKLVVLYGLAVLVFALIPVQERKMAKDLTKELSRKIIIGIISLVLFPVIVLVSTLSIIGIPLVPILILSFMIIKFIGYVAIALFIGTRIKQVGEMKINVFIKLLLGVIILWLASNIPFLGIIFYLIISILALGVVIDTKFGTNQPWFDNQKINHLPKPKDDDQNDDQ